MTKLQCVKIAILGLQVNRALLNYIKCDGLLRGTINVDVKGASRH